MTSGIQKSTDAVPGEAGVWVFVLGDMLAFALFFAVYSYYRALDVAAFAIGQATLNPNYGALNTLLLLVSSWFVVLAVADARERGGRLAPRLFMAACVCGVAFVVLKAFEYGEKFEAGFTVTTSDFFMYYFVFTGLHLIHVLIGIGVLIYLIALARSDMSGPNDFKLMESGAVYWHMVDLLWIVLFPLLYLMQ